MDREILFRGKSKNGNKWVHGDLISPKNNENCYSIFEIGGGCVKVKSDTIGQYIGLKDKNGTRIFAGDIIEVWQTHSEDKKHYRAIVEFGNPNAQYDWGWQLVFIDKDFSCNSDILLWIGMEDVGVYCKVIGNIYDNPELLGGQNGSVGN